MPKPRQKLSALETDLMRALWRRERATVVELVAILNESRPDSPLQRGTVHVLLGRLEEKGWITREKEGRAYLYRPTISEQEGMGEIADVFGEQVFGGSPVALVQCLVNGEGLKQKEIEQLRAILDEADAALRSQPSRWK